MGKNFVSQDNIILGLTVKGEESWHDSDDIPLEVQSLIDQAS